MTRVSAGRRLLYFQLSMKSDGIEGICSRKEKSGWKKEIMNVRAESVLLGACL